MSIAEYPYLRAFADELSRILTPPETRPNIPNGNPALRVGPGRDVRDVEYPGLGTYRLTTPQLLVVRELLSALLHSRSPDVDQAHLLRASGLKASRLRDVFARNPAWGELVLPGSSAGTYRLYAPPAAVPSGENPNDAEPEGWD